MVVVVGLYRRRGRMGCYHPGIIFIRLIITTTSNNNIIIQDRP